VVLAPLAGLASAATYGMGDFFAGVASRRASVFVVALGSQLVGFVLLPIVALALRDPFPATRDILWATGAGASSFLGIAGLYGALAAGRMGVAAPLTGVIAAAVPVAYAWSTGGSPGALPVAGMMLALFGIALVSGPRAERPSLRVLALATLSGLGFAGFLLMMGLSRAESVAWPLTAARIATVGGFLVAVALARPALRGAPWRLILATGILVALGDVAYLLAARWGRLDVAVVLSSLYPAATVAMARVFLKEQLTATQMAGALVMLAAIPLIAMSG